MRKRVPSLPVALGVLGLGAAVLSATLPRIDLPTPVTWLGVVIGVVALALGFFWAYQAGYAQPRATAQAQRQLADWIGRGEAFKRELRGLTDHDMDALQRSWTAHHVELWAVEVRDWLYAELPRQLGLFTSNTRVGGYDSVNEIESFLDTRIVELRRILERL